MKHFKMIPWWLNWYMYIILNMDEQSEVAGACLKSWPSWNMVIIAYKIRFIFNKIMTSHYKESLQYQKLRLSRTCFFINKHVWKTNLLTCLSPWIALNTKVQMYGNIGNSSKIEVNRLILILMNLMADKNFFFSFAF